MGDRYTQVPGVHWRESLLRKYKVLTKIKDVLFMCYILHKGVSGMASDGKNN